MNAFAKMDIFFFVTTLATVVLAVFVGVLLFYIVRAARDVSRITHIVEKESEQFAKGTKTARHQLRGKMGEFAQWLVGFVQSFGEKKGRTREKNNSK